MLAMRLLLGAIALAVIAACGGGGATIAPANVPSPTAIPPSTVTPVATEAFSAIVAAPSQTPVPFAILVLAASAFSEGEPIPLRYSCDGEDISPSLAWSGVPQGTETWVVIMDDPDAPRGTWDHWVVFNIPADVRGLEEAQPDTAQLPNGGVHGKNSWGKAKYGGPCPPRGPAHNYRFFLYAVDINLELPAGASKKDVLQAVDGHIVGESILKGTFAR